MRSPTNEAVVLIHGLAAHTTIMRRLESFIGSHGYQVTNWGYQSITRTVSVYAAAFQQELARLDAMPQIQRLHIVTHSMGSIVTRCTLSGYRPDKLQRIVMLAPPNAGSYAARYLSKPLGRICPPLFDLSDDPESFVNQLDEPQDCEIGVIAAKFDHVVPRRSTHLSCQRDYIVLPSLHSMLPLKRKTAKQVLHFLQNGCFDHSAVLTTPLF